LQNIRLSLAEDEGVGREALLELLSSIQRTDRVEEIKNDYVTKLRD
jgi:hypothetical protein